MPIKGADRSVFDFIVSEPWARVRVSMQKFRRNVTICCNQQSGCEFDTTISIMNFCIIGHKKCLRLSPQTRKMGTLCKRNRKFFYESAKNNRI